MSKSKSKLTFYKYRMLYDTIYYIKCGNDVYSRYGEKLDERYHHIPNGHLNKVKCEETSFNDMTIIYDLDKVNDLVFLNSKHLTFRGVDYDLEYILFVLKSLPSLPNKGSYTIEDDSNFYSDVLTISRSRGNYHVGCQTLSEKDRKTLIKAIEWHMSN